MAKLYLYVEEGLDSVFSCKYSFSTEPRERNDDFLGEVEISDNAGVFLQSLERFNKKLMDEILTAACVIIESSD